MNETIVETASGGGSECNRIAVSDRRTEKRLNC